MTPETTMATEPAPGNFFSRIFGLYFSPGETFKDIGRTSPVLVPMILLAVVIAAAVFVTLRRVDMETMLHKQFDPMVERGWMPQDRADEMIKQTLANPTRTYVQGAVQAAVMTIIIALAIAGIFKLVSLVFGTENTYKSLLSVTLFTSIATAIVSLVITTIVVYLQSPTDIDPQNPVGSNLGAVLSIFLGKDSLPGFVRAFATFIDIFAIWKIALLAIGYAAVSKRLKTASAAMWLSVLYLGTALILSPIFGMFM